eukprot:TRINITY_DN5917_c0_g1_i1.p1 TRINITY_DN5917_c0_g1~~TRINITY_DN5917_c0_g1_i1.p1  ORF type:complete len:195 (+),score=40.26 TRINITY_DN5917_c0_g1_i1:171-755(+)
MKGAPRGQMRGCFVGILLLCLCAQGAEYKYVSEYVGEHAEKSCRYIGRDMEPRGDFDPVHRCQAFTDTVEDHVSEQTTMILSKVGTTMEDTVDTARSRANTQPLKRYLLDLSRWYLLSVKQPSKKALLKRVRESALSQWMLNICTIQGSRLVDEMSDEAIANLRRQGVKVDTGGVDPTDLEMYNSEDWGVHDEL